MRLQKMSLLRTRVAIFAQMMLVVMLSGCNFPAIYHGKSGLDPMRNAQADLAAGVAIAEKTGQRVLIYAGGDWCAWCNIWTDYKKENPEFDAFLDRAYVTVPIHFGPGQMNREFFSQFPRFTAAPHYIFLESDGTYLHDQNLACCEAPGGVYDAELVKGVFLKWAPSPLPRG